jgi:glycosyltransferase involved in cell wall biosynthesis
MSYISVVIPCFNLGQFLPEAVESVRNQTVRPAELIIVDDGSTDEATLSTLAMYRDQGLTVHRTSNKGAPAARNYGIARSTSEYILCLDADDILLPEYLQEVAPILDERQEIGIVTPHVEFFGDKVGIWKTMDYNPPALLRENCISSASMFRKICWEQVGGYHNIPAFQDWDFWISIMEAGWKWSVVAKPLYRYRVRPKSISEYGRSNRGQLLRTILQRHSASYQKHFEEIFIATDNELCRARNLNGKYAHDNAAKTLTIEVLKQAVQRLGGNAFIAAHEAGQTIGDENKPADRIEAANQRLDALDRERSEIANELARWRNIEQIQSLICEHVPSTASVLVVSRGDDQFLCQLECQAAHFPQGENGLYAGYHPANSADAIYQLERLRAQGAEYILFPASAAWWLEYYDDFATFLTLHYAVVARTDDGTVLFSLAARPERQLNRFSVIICTFRRAAFIGKAIESLFKQRYPKDKFEIIVINNDSPDDTESIVKEFADRSPVPFKYLIEKRNGLSYARNLGIAHANYEYVAHLDDDATACPNWLASFNEVINDHHALVVGGRVEKVFEPGFVPPEWFNFQYLQGFFGLNYREWGKKEKSFRIRYPRYIGGGNSVYAKWLYEHFGGYDPRLGRDGKTLLAAEETYLNLQLDSHDVPIYYSDDAVIYHFIESDRVTKKHIRTKARWSGISNAIMYTMFHDRDVAKQKVSASLAELKRLARELITLRRNPKTFSRYCRFVNLASFLIRYFKLRLRERLGHKLYRPSRVDWNPSKRIEELQKLPDSKEKFRELYHIYCAFDDDEAARLAYKTLWNYVPQSGSRAAMLPPAHKMESNRRYEKLVESLRQVVDAELPADAEVIVVSKGDGELLKLDGRKSYHFPQLNSGEYAGYYPASCSEAIEQLNRLLAKGATHLVLPSTSLWWLEHYPDFREHLVSCYSSVFDDPTLCLIFDLRRRSIACNREPDQVGKILSALHAS